MPGNFQLQSPNSNQINPRFTYQNNGSPFTNIVENNNEQKKSENPSMENQKLQNSLYNSPEKFGYRDTNTN